MDLELIQKTISLLQLNDDDIIYNVYMPTNTCDKCGGSGVEAWNNDDSVLCECLLEVKDEQINYGLLKRLATIKKSEIYHD